jgi:hypothetical protein
MAGTLFAISPGVDLAHPGAERQAVQTNAPEDSVDTGIRHLDAMIALQVPDDADWPEMVFAPQLQDFLYDLIGCPVRVAPGNRSGVNKALDAVPAIGVTPDPELSACNGH